MSNFTYDIIHKVYLFICGPYKKANGIQSRKTKLKALHKRVPKITELAKKECPRLRDSACWRSGEITQPRTHFFGQLCTYRKNSAKSMQGARFGLF